MLATSITQKGQVTLPVEIRRQLKLKAGDRLAFRVEGARIIAEPVPADISSLFGVVKTDKSLSLPAIKQVIAEQGE